MSEAGRVPGDRVVEIESREVLAAGGRAGEVRPLQPIQRAGLWMATLVALIIVAVAAPILVGWATRAPAPPDLAGLEPAAARVAVENYQALSSAWSDTARALFEETVVRTLLPVFTLILGYVFGSQGRG